MSRFFAILLLSISFQASGYDSQTELGQALYFDRNLSLNRTQSCATCHSPEHGFVDPRENGIEKMASLGDDGVSLGDRHAPSAAYAKFSPSFHINRDGTYVGGQFHDGRASSLADQAAGPPLNPGEMNMPGKAAVLARVKENPKYVDAFDELFGVDTLDDAEAGYAAMTQAIASFERSDLFSPFDSKYDRYLRGEYEMTKMEDLGMTLFFSQQFTNCNLCHQLRKNAAAQDETFTNYQFHNIGVPVNTRLRAANGKGMDFVDRGLLEHPEVTDRNQAGKFKTPTLRNVAVTAPYMHNGVFKDLKTVVLFYNKYNSRSAKRQINLETGKRWASPEVSENRSLKKLEHGPALNEKRINALVAFMKTLTDKRYEHLIND